MEKPRILIIDDEKDIRTLIERLLRLEGYEVFQAENGASGLKLLEKQEVHTVICDVKLPDAHGLELLPKIKKIQPLCEVILLTAYGTIPDGVQAIKEGAFDYITKGDDNRKIYPLVNRATEKAMLQYRVRELEARVGGQVHFSEIVGKSSELKRAIDMARKVAATDATVLLNGDTGTGKEVFARAIHCESLRKSQPFVAVNCSALGKELLESEMFGHKAGAFTGATHDKKGLFQEADKGTIFLDEIGEMDLALQAKLLRVLETGAFLRVGETKETKVDVRVIAATNRDLQAESEKGQFRADLFYRLSVFQIRLPSLQERREDIPLLARHFIQTTTDRMNRKAMEMSDEFEHALQQHHWKGNIRELKNIIERAVILSDGLTLTPDSLPFDFLQDEPLPGDSPLSLQAVEERHIRKVLAYTKGNKTRTAEILGIGLTTLYRKMEEYGIEK
jgi:two-component system NtrC family response regulator